MGCVRGGKQTAVAAVSVAGKVRTRIVGQRRFPIHITKHLSCEICMTKSNLRTENIITCSGARVLSVIEEWSDYMSKGIRGFREKCRIRDIGKERSQKSDDKNKKPTPQVVVATFSTEKSGDD